jgi:putative Holliday junction resolvase
MSQSRKYLALDIGEKRIGIAAGDDVVKIAVPMETVEVDGNELEAIAKYVAREEADVIVVGYPRNQSGEATAQTAYVEAFAKQLEGFAPKVVFQDESLTSVLAEQRLKATGKPYTKGDIDAHAASLILEDYLENQA